MRTRMAILAVPLIVAACSGGAAPASRSPSLSATQSPRYAVATGSDQQILRISLEGGFTSPTYQLTRTPTLALYGDGRVIVPGPTSDANPGPLLPDLHQERVTPAEIQTIVAAADAAGLLGPDASYGNPGVADAPATVFALTVAGTTHVISAMALGGGMDGPDTQGVDQRARLLAFENSMTNLSGLLGRTVSDDGPYQPAGYDVFSSEAEPDPTQPSIDWPLARDPGTAGATTVVDGVRCLAVKGADLAPFLATARTASPTTIWKAASGKYSISVRPLYPDESGCQATAG